MTIVNPLPYTIQNGQAVDAVPVMANFNQIVSNVNANAAPVAGNAAQTFAVADATASNHAVNWAQAGAQMLVPTTSSTITPAAFNTIVYTNFSAAGTITVNPGVTACQRVRVYGCGYTVTVQPNVTSGSPVLTFPDGSASYSWSIGASGGYNQFIEMVWDGLNWRCTTVGQTVVVAATQSNAAVNLGQANSLYAPANVLSTATTPPQFDNSTALATTAFVKRSGLLFNSWVTYSATGNISIADAGRTIQLAPSAAITLTLPAANAAPSGTAIFLKTPTAIPSPSSDPAATGLCMAPGA